MSFVFDILGGFAGKKAADKQAKAMHITAGREEAAAEAEAKQLETRARQGLAVGSYNSERVQKRAREIMASQRAAAASGGGDTTDATVQAITDETIRGAAMESLLTMAEAEDRAKQDRYGAAVRRVTGKQAADAQRTGASAAKIGGYATLISGVGQAVGSDSWARTFGS